MYKTALALCIAASAWRGAWAGADEVKRMALWYYSLGEYYGAITEIMRYQCLYPSGSWYRNSMLLMGKAYYKGSNYQAALDQFIGCYQAFPDAAEGEEALYLAGFVHLTRGSPAEAMKLHDLYRYTYREGPHLEELDRDACYAAALERDLPGAMNIIKKYRGRYPRGKYGADVDRLEKNLIEDGKKPRKLLWLSVVGSVFFPGFGHFYTGNYAVGFLTLFTNALCGFMIYNGYRRHDTYQMVFFGCAGALVYSYNLFGAVRAANEYNERRDRKFFNTVRLGITASF